MSCSARVRCSTSTTASSDIEHVAEDVRPLVPEARVAIAHGQIDEGGLERRGLGVLASGELDVLVCTTIVESGLDIHGEHPRGRPRRPVGLAQLYQLRGRVGRARPARLRYLLYPATRALRKSAYERLKTIGEFTDLGSGFKMAMRDLEIRGAGNLLGAEQRGHIAAVGFDLYVEMVAEAVGELTGEVRDTPAEVVIDLPADANLPRDYVPRRRAVEAYRRLGGLDRCGAVDDVDARVGRPLRTVAAPARTLIDVARVRVACIDAWHKGALSATRTRAYRRVGHAQEHRDSPATAGSEHQDQRRHGRVPDPWREARQRGRGHPLGARRSGPTGSIAH